MKLQTRKLIASGAGVFFILAGLCIAILGQFLVDSLGNILFNSNSLYPWSVPQDNSIFYVLFVLGLCIATGLSVSVLFWTPRPGYAVRLTVYVIMLVFMLPVSVYNYAHADFLINRSAQAVFNFVLIFLGAIVVVELIRLKASARDLVVLQVVAVFLLSLTSVFVPATFSIVWTLESLGAITQKAAGTISIPTLSTVSAAFSALISYLKYRSEIKSDKDHL